MAQIGNKIEVISGHHKGKKGFIKAIDSEREIINSDSPCASDRKVYKCAPELVFGDSRQETAVPFTVRDGEFVVLK